ncbi:MAG: Two-component transcriptional response regulator, LuxR family [Nitrospira sp.]|jgi:CheY-like chemotaxis protein|nr:MAG: Two-component transcriptional response regulator, LuxR family [Nitrospira sp.]
MSILIIDDFQEERDLLQGILHSAGFGPLLPIATAREGLQHLGVGKKGKATSAVDLVLMDLEMPEIDGLEACRQIRADERLQSLPIIVITAHSAAEDIQASYTAGATDYIRKPVIPAELIARTATALSLKQEVDARKIREQELLERTKELDHAFEQITTLRGTLHICAKCKRVKTDGVHWQRIEDYLRQQARSKVTEAVCDSCLHQAYPHLKQAR